METTFEEEGEERKKPGKRSRRDNPPKKEHLLPDVRPTVEFSTKAMSKERQAKMTTGSHPILQNDQTAQQDIPSKFYVSSKISTLLQEVTLAEQETEEKRMVKILERSTSDNDIKQAKADSPLRKKRHPQGEWPGFFTDSKQPPSQVQKHNLTRDLSDYGETQVLARTISKRAKQATHLFRASQVQMHA
jgi:hypothetical protein